MTKRNNPANIFVVNMYAENTLVFIKGETCQGVLMDDMKYINSWLDTYIRMNKLKLNENKTKC